jgi:sorbitol-specific phosphotransferase system component IIC
MHVLLVIAGGLVLLGVFVLFGWLWAASAAGMVVAAKLFMPVWLLIACTNMWVGVTQAGYSLRDEALILLIVLIVPVLLACVITRLLSHA